MNIQIKRVLLSLLISVVLMVFVAASAFVIQFVYSLLGIDIWVITCAVHFVGFVVFNFFIYIVFDTLAKSNQSA
ncbi:MAG: hypothetical protein AAFN77_16790 [Planctomycetota bacterium]